MGGDVKAAGVITPRLSVSPSTAQELQTNWAEVEKSEKDLIKR